MTKPMTAHALRTDATAPVYPNDLTPALQETLAILADLAFAHEAARERLGLWDGPEAVKREIGHDLDARYEAAKAPYERRLAALQEHARATARLAAVG